MNVACADMTVVEVKFRRNIEFNSDQKTEVSVKVEPVYGINENQEAENSRLMLSFTAGEEENKNNPFFVKLLLLEFMNGMVLRQRMQKKK